jgi:hypothetical protein
MVLVYVRKTTISAKTASNKDYHIKNKSEPKVEKMGETNK